MKHLRLFILILCICFFKNIAGQNALQTFYKKIEFGRYIELHDAYKDLSVSQQANFKSMYYAFNFLGSNDNQSAIKHFEQAVFHEWKLHGGDFIFLSKELLYLYTEEKQLDNAWKLYQYIKGNYLPASQKFFRDSAYNDIILSYCGEIERYLNIVQNRPMLKREIGENVFPIDCTSSPGISTDMIIKNTKVRVMWDTGAPAALSLSQKHIEQLGLSYSKDSVMYIDTVRIAHFLFLNVPVTIRKFEDFDSYLSLQSIPSKKKRKAKEAYNTLALPIIGLPLLKEMGCWTIDWKKKKISFDTLNVCPKYETSLSLSVGRLCSQVSIHDTTFIGMIDLGSNGFVDLKQDFYADNKELFHLAGKPTEAIHYFTIYGIKKKPQILLRSPIMKFGNRRVHSNRPIELLENDYEHEKNWDILLGISFFKTLGRRTTFDFTRMKLQIW